VALWLSDEHGAEYEHERVAVEGVSLGNRFAFSTQNVRRGFKSHSVSSMFKVLGAAAAAAVFWPYGICLCR